MPILLLPIDFLDVFMVVEKVRGSLGLSHDGAPRELAIDLSQPIPQILDRLLNELFKSDDVALLGVLLRCGVGVEGIVEVIHVLLLCCQIEPGDRHRVV